MKESGRMRAPCVKKIIVVVETSRSTKVSKRKQEIVPTAHVVWISCNVFLCLTRGRQRRKHLVFPWKPHFFIFRCVTLTSSQLPRRRYGRAGILGRQLTWPEMSPLHGDEVKSDLERWQTQQPSSCWGMFFIYQTRVKRLAVYKLLLAVIWMCSDSSLKWEMYFCSLHPH